jgi:hypothetical protein
MKNSKDKFDSLVPILFVIGWAIFITAVALLAT